MTSYASSIPFDEVRIRAAAVYCSDGRFGEQFDDLLQTHLQLPKYDRLALPGGPCCYAGHFDSYREAEAASAQLKLLISVHQLERIILIAHQNCAYYSERLRISPLKMEAQQHEDLHKAIEQVRQFGRELQIEAYFARVVKNQIVFETVEA